MAATLWPRSGSFEFTASGVPATGAKAYFFDSGTSTPRAVYQDSALTTPHAHPVVADGNGRWPAVYLPYGDYKLTLTTSGGSTLFTADGITNPAPLEEDTEIDADAQYQTGDYIFVGRNGTRPGAVRCNGRTIGNAASSATERANADTADLFAYIWNNYANGQAAVSGGRGASAAADYAANKTIALPDHRSAGLVGFDDMGNSAASLAGSAPVVSGSAILAGSIIGANTHTLLKAQLPTDAAAGTISQITPAGTIAQITPAGTIAQITPAGTINDTRTWLWSTTTAAETGTGANVVPTMNTGASTVPVVVGTGGISFSGTPFTPVFTGTAFTPVFTGTPTTPTFTGSALGSGTAHNIMSRVTPVTILMKL